MRLSHLSKNIECLSIFIFVLFLKESTGPSLSHSQIIDLIEGEEWEPILVPVNKLCWVQEWICVRHLDH
jgi:hypothetical protein